MENSMSFGPYNKNLLTIRGADFGPGESEFTPLGILQILVFIYFIKNIIKLQNPDTIITSDNFQAAKTGMTLCNTIKDGDKINFISTPVVKDNIFNGSIDYIINHGCLGDNKFIIVIIEQKAFDSYTQANRWHNREAIGQMAGILFRSGTWEDMYKYPNTNSSRHLLRAQNLNFAYMYKNYNSLITAIGNHSKKFDNKAFAEWLMRLDIYDDNEKTPVAQSLQQEIEILKQMPLFKMMLRDKFYSFEK